MCSTNCTTKLFTIINWKRNPLPLGGGEPNKIFIILNFALVGRLSSGLTQKTDSVKFSSLMKKVNVVKSYKLIFIYWDTIIYFLLDY